MASEKESRKGSIPRKSSSPGGLIRLIRIDYTRRGQPGDDQASAIIRHWYMFSHHLSV